MGKLTDLQIQRKNANKHTPRGLGALEQSIQQDGWIGAITVAADGETFDGSARIEVGTATGFDEAIVVESDGSKPVIVKRVDIPSTDDPRAVRLGIAANRVAQLDLDWDASVLAELAESVDLSQLFRDEEMAALLAGVGAPDVGGAGDEFQAEPEDGPTRTALGDLWRISGNGLEHRLVVGDCTDPAVVERLMGGGRAKESAIITDPPYGYSLTEWDQLVDVSVWTALWLPFARGFYAVFGQMPSIHDWHCAALAQKAHFCEHVVWVKRITTPMHRLNRSHESIYVYAIGERKMFYQTTGRFEDVKLPGVLVDTVSLEGIDRHVKDLRRKTAGLGTGMHRTGGANRFGSDGKKLGSGIETDRSPEFANYTNVWSFLPPTQAVRDGIDKDTHQTGKPIEIIERLIEMLTPRDALVIDPFLGSGTAVVAAHRLGRRCFGCEIKPAIADTVLARAEAAGLTCTRVDDPER